MADSDELSPTTVVGYKPAAQKSIEELRNLDANDESLKKWKDSLLKNSVPSNTGIEFIIEREILIELGERAKVEVLALAMEVEGRPDVCLPLDDGNATSASNIVIKEGIDYRMKIRFKIYNQVVVGLKYLQIVKRKGIRGENSFIPVDKSEEMVGSYAPSVNEYERKFPVEQAPSGLLARGHYSVHSRFIDDDGICHLDVHWTFDIKKEWE